MSTAERPYRRNYKQMDVGKLIRSIRQLEDGHGEAFDKVIDHDGDLENELRRAREALAEKEA